ncbi:winged helix-turn-helix transcriptional regulator [Candidatus Curtissbacteria bacterium]|nr:winged helix-turn-helix transcriptional regulator [Candidatus Curtissbacteria bacterium]
MKHTLTFHSIGFAKKLDKVIGFKSSPLSLSYSQASAVLVSDSQKEISQREIASHLHLEPATVVTLIDELEKLKLVKRLHTNGDRRKYKVVLTNKGKSAARQIKNRTWRINNYLKSQLSKKEFEMFNKSLEKLTNALDKWKGGENEIPGTKRHLAA